MEASKTGRGKKVEAKEGAKDGDKKDQKDSSQEGAQ